jgi:hypothetical protein
MLTFLTTITIELNTNKVYNDFSPDLWSEAVRVISVHGEEFLTFAAFDALVYRRPVDAQTIGTLERRKKRLYCFQFLG